MASNGVTCAFSVLVLAAAAVLERLGIADR
jgi:hypothetical protein